MEKYQIVCSIVAYKSNIIQLNRAINSFLDTKLSVKLLIIDNSPDARIKTLLPKNEKIQYIFNNANLGYGAAHNIGIREYINKTDYYLVLNPDVYFNAGVLERIIDFMNLNQDIGNLMPKVLYPDGSVQFLCKLLPTPYDWIGRRFNPMKSLVEKRNNYFELRFTGYKSVMDIPYLSGCFMFLRTNALIVTELFDERIFMYGEETDLCRRLISKGFRTVFYPMITIFHEFEKGSHKSLRLTWIGIKSAFYYFNKWGWFFDEERKMINNLTLQKIKQSESK